MNDFRGHKILTTLTILALLVSVIGGISDYSALMQHMPHIALNFMLGWLCLSVIFAFVSLLEFVPGFLLTAFCMLIGWRISGLYNVSIVMWPQCLTLTLLLLNFMYCAYDNLRDPSGYLHKLSLGDWQLIFIRIYIGFDFIPHFTEKLFAGSVPHMADVNYFTSIHVPDSNFFVWLAGFCEFGAAIVVGLGLLMRVGALGAILYLFIATYLGGHFLFGFIWASTGGGWEFPLYWMVLMLTFVATGSHQFSLDQFLEDRFRLPAKIKKFL